MIRKCFNNIKTTNGNKGFTLIEMLIGMTIFSIGILALGAMQIAAVNGNASARRQTEAVSWAADRAETLLAMPYDDITTPDEPVTQGIYEIMWTVTEIDLDGNAGNDAKSVQVNVTWNDRGGTKSSNLIFIKTAS
jgi:type IV pilus assembly protein PilV